MKLPFLPDFRSRDGSFGGSGVTNGYVETRDMAQTVEDAVLKRPGLEYKYEFGPGFLGGAIRDYDNSWFIFKDNKIYRNPKRTWVPGGGTGITSLDVVWQDCKARNLWKNGNTLYFSYQNAGGNWAVRSYDTITGAKSEVGQCSAGNAFDYFNTSFYNEQFAMEEVSGVLWAAAANDLGDGSAEIIFGRSFNHGVDWIYSTFPSAAFYDDVRVELIREFGATAVDNMLITPANFKFTKGLSSTGAYISWVAIPVWLMRTDGNFGAYGVFYMYVMVNADNLGHGPVYHSAIYNYPDTSTGPQNSPGGFVRDVDNGAMHILPEARTGEGRMLTMFGNYMHTPKTVGPWNPLLDVMKSPIIVDAGGGKQDMYALSPRIYRDIFSTSTPDLYAPILPGAAYWGHQLNDAKEWFIVRNDDLTKAHWAAGEGHWETGAEQIIDLGSTPLQLSIVAAK